MLRQPLDDWFIEHYKKLYPISNNIEVYGDQVWRTKKIPHCSVKFEAGKENRIGTVFLFCWYSKDCSTVRMDQTFFRVHEPSWLSVLDSDGWILCTQRPPPCGLHLVFQQIPGTNSSRASKIDNSQSASVCLMNYLDVHILWEPQTIQEIIFTRHFRNLRKPSNSMAFLLPSWTPLAGSQSTIVSRVGGSRDTRSCFTNKL